jgi:hypothetical protein
MDRFAEQTQPDPQYEAMVKAKNDMYSFLQKKGMADVGVGIGYNEKTQKWCLAIHLQSPVPVESDPDLSKLLEGNWKGTEVRVKHVGRIVAY